MLMRCTLELASIHCTFFCIRKWKLFFSCFTASWRAFYVRGEDWLGLLAIYLIRSDHFRGMFSFTLNATNDCGAVKQQREEKENDDLSRVSFLKRFAIKSNTSYLVDWKVKGIMIEFRKSGSLSYLEIVFTYAQPNLGSISSRMSKDNHFFVSNFLSVQQW